MVFGTEGTTCTSIQKRLRSLGGQQTTYHVYIKILEMFSLAILKQLCTVVVVSKKKKKKIKMKYVSFQI